MQLNYSIKSIKLRNGIKIQFGFLLPNEPSQLHHLGWIHWADEVLLNVIIIFKDSHLA